MAWLHTWSGLLVGWVLFFVFLTGTLGYVNYEISRWMKPEIHAEGLERSTEELLALAESRLREQAPNAEYWSITFPGDRSSNGLSVAWRALPEEGESYGKYTSERLDQFTGVPVTETVRDTGGGFTLYRMHYALHYVPYQWAIRIVGICTMFMFIAILSGVITHKKIFKDFFSFRPGKGQRSWLDAHNLLSVTALPFHLMITYSGLLFFMFTYMPVTTDVLYPEGPARDAFYDAAYGRTDTDEAAKQVPATTITLSGSLSRAEQLWGPDSVKRIFVRDINTAGARIAVQSHGGRYLTSHEPSLLFNGVTGEELPGRSEMETTPGAFNSVLFGLHEGLFAGGVIRVLYVFAGLAGTAMIGTGLLLWSAKRKAKMTQRAKGTAPVTHFGLAIVDRLNLGTIIGLPIAIAAYFWANRLLPVQDEIFGIHRHDMEPHAMFLTWAILLIYPVWRPLDRAWTEMCGLAAAVWFLLPVVNAITTDRHLLGSLPAGDWDFAGFDLACLLAGGFFLHLAQRMRRRETGTTGTPQRTKPSKPSHATASPNP